MEKVECVVVGAGPSGSACAIALADGFDRCDFRYSEDGVVKLEEPFTVEKFREWGIDTAKKVIDELDSKSRGPSECRMIC